MKSSRNNARQLVGYIQKQSPYFLQKVFEINEATCG